MDPQQERLTDPNEDQKAALDAVLTQHLPVVFITGGAGTGKTALVHELKAVMNERHQNVIIVATTGIAAINAGGSTIHSQFKIKADRPPSINRSAYENDQNLTETIHGTQTLIIDEVSMVRADMLDVIIAIIKHYGPEPLDNYGGIQLVLVGDLLQLPPILVPSERKHYRIKGYDPNNTFFLAAHSLRKEDMTVVVLKQNYRLQTTDPYAVKYLHYLNIIRKGFMIKSPKTSSLAPSGPDEPLNLLNQQQPTELETACAFFNSRHESKSYRNCSIAITANKIQRDNINNKRMKKLQGDLYTFNATINDKTGRSPEDAFAYCKQTFLSPPTLCLKIGARVMITKNMSVSGLKLVNGTMADIINIRKLPDLTEDEISASMELTPWKPLPPVGANFVIDLRLRTLYKDKEITIGRETWQQTDFVLDKQTKKLVEEPAFEYTQYPIMLAWAVTIHKSQGLTLEDYAILHTGNPTPHLVYVALSRAAKFSDIHLDSKIKAQDIFTIPMIQEFYESLEGR